jgi:hypothetical protein
MTPAPYTAAEVDGIYDLDWPRLRATVATLDEARAEVERERAFLAEALACSSQHEATARTLRADLAAARAHVEALVRLFRDEAGEGSEMEAAIAVDAARDWLAAQGQPDPAPDVDPEPWRGEFYVGSFVGPCAHGRDPYTRCDVCEGLTPREAMEAASFAAGVLSVTAAQGQPDPAPGVVVRKVAQCECGCGPFVTYERQPAPAPSPDPWALLEAVVNGWGKGGIVITEAIAAARAALAARKTGGR